MTETTSAERGGLPIPPTALIGRDREIAEVCELIGRPDVRLVTLTGPGGIGKTRLAIDVASRLEATFADGVVFVPMAAVRDASLAIPTLAHALGAPPAGGVDPRDALTQALAQKRLLIVVDNVEQIRDAAGDFAWLLSAAEGVELLVTSRARLHLRGEHEYVVPPLPLPTDDAGRENPAVALFVERALEVAPRLTPSAEEARAIAQICRRLDGIPLAIELAAAKSKVLPPEALLARLERRLQLLTGGPRDLPARLRTMRDAIASSYDDLAAEQQRLFRALCVFSGGFTLTMAKSVAADPGPDGQSAGATAELDERLLQLVDDSLVASGPVESEPRFSILETIREFGVDELAAQSELDHVSARHTAFFLDFAEAALARLSGAGRTTWLDRLDRDQANLRTALTWLCESGETAQAVQLAGALWQFWWWRSHLEEGLTWLERVAALPGADQTGSAYARLLTGLGSFAETSGDLAAAERFHDEAARAWQAINDPRGLAMSLLFRWLVAFSNDDEARMNALSSESARLFEQAGDRWGIAMSLMEQGVMAMRKSRNEQGEHLLTNAISTFASIEDAWGVAICRGALGNIRTDQKRYDDAESVLKESLSALVQLNDLWGLATIFPAAVRLAAEQGRFEAVAHAAGALESMHHRLGAPLRVPFRHAYGANLTRAQATLGKARFDTLLAEGAEMSPATAVTAAFAATARGKGSASDQPAPLAALAFPLSAREREVLRLMPFKSAAEIAHELFIAESTVRTHFNNIYSKLGVANQKEAIAYIYQHRLI